MTRLGWAGPMMWTSAATSTCSTRCTGTCPLLLCRVTCHVPRVQAGAGHAAGDPLPLHPPAPAQDRPQGGGVRHHLGHGGMER